MVWTHEQLQSMRRKLLDEIVEIKQEFPNTRSLPPMSENEAFMMLSALCDVAQTRTLTRDEAFLHGQLLSAFRMGVMANTLGHNGRFFVVSEEDIERLAARK